MGGRGVLPRDRVGGWVVGVCCQETGWVVCEGGDRVGGRGVLPGDRVGGWVVGVCCQAIVCCFNAVALPSDSCATSYDRVTMLPSCDVTRRVTSLARVARRPATPVRVRGGCVRHAAARLDGLDPPLCLQRRLRTTVCQRRRLHDGRRGRHAAIQRHRHVSTHWGDGVHCID